jgi:hypothetical protein
LLSSKIFLVGADPEKKSGLGIFVVDLSQQIPIFVRQSGQVFWGDCLLEVDRQACQLVGEVIPNYLQAIQNMQK